jgi:hydroxyethylthiazole kinase
VNDCANVTLAIGASPIMADDINEVEEITSISKAFVLNIGTLNERTVESMIKAGKTANKIGIPVVFDPVGAGASSFRNKTTEKILSEVKINILRGNMSEIRFIAGISSNTKGVDASEEDMLSKDGDKVANTLAKKLKCIVAITGKEDIISDGERVAKLNNGHSMLSNVTGTGCMTTSLIGSYAGATDDYFTAAIGGILSMGIAGEIAFETTAERGNGSFHMAIVDAISKLDSNIIKRRTKINEA